MSDPTVAFSDYQQALQELLTAAKEASEVMESEELVAIEVERTLREQRDHVANIEAGIAAQVSREKDDATGKPVFSNDLQRKAEVAERLAVHNVYRDAVRSLAETEGEQRVRRIRIEKLSRDYSISKLAFEVIGMGRRER